MIGRSDERGYILQQYTENDSVVILENGPETEPIYAIGDKAFLSRRDVVKVLLPDSVRKVGDWAFAHMKKLEEISFPAEEIDFGRKVFLGCDNLLKVTVRGRDAEDRAYLTAASLKLCGENLLKPAKEDADWYRAYDAVLLQFLAEKDTDGFEPAFIGWFQDEDVDDQRELYGVQKRKDKVKYALQRLVFDAYLAPDTMKMLKAFLLTDDRERLDAVTEQMDAGNGAFFGDCLRLVRMWKEVGGFAYLSATELLERLPEADPEVRAYLMECAVPAGSDDFFAGFDL